MRNTEYLQRLGQSWYVRVKVPAALQGRVGNTHIRRALGTRDLDEAVRRKWSALATIRAYLDAMAGVSPIATNCNLVIPSPRLQSIANAELQQVLKLDALLDKWLDSTGSLKTTQFQRRQAYGELRAFLGGVGGGIRRRAPRQVSR